MMVYTSIAQEAKVTQDICNRAQREQSNPTPSAMQNNFNKNSQSNNKFSSMQNQSGGHGYYTRNNGHMNSILSNGDEMVGSSPIFEAIDHYGSNPNIEKTVILNFELRRRIDLISL